MLLALAISVRGVDDTFGYLTRKRMDEIDTCSDSRLGLRLVLFAALLGAYLISGIVPVSTYTDGDGNHEYLFGHHAFLSGLMSEPRGRTMADRPHVWGLLANVAFWVGMTMLFRGEWLGVAAAGVFATSLAIGCYGI